MGRLGRRTLMAMALMVSMTLAACGNRAAALDPAEAVNIRIENRMESDIRKIWLGSGPEVGSTYQTRYVNVGVGEVSDYQTVEANPNNYREWNLLMAGGERFDSLEANAPKDMLGQDLVAGSYYTFVLVQDGDRALLSDLTVDSP